MSEDYSDKAYYEDCLEEQEFHFLNPTFITNFDKEEEQYYRMAIWEYGNKNLYIEESVGYEGGKSLHIKTRKDFDLSDLWEILRSIEKDFGKGGGQH